MTSMDSVSRRSYGDNKAPDGGKPWRPHPLPPPQYFTKSLRKVQVVYYLARNTGRLEHPHYIEVTLPPNQPLRLKDVLDRLVALRGTVMPSQYSWSCKRSYRNGYIWFDLAPNDIIHPSQGAEYVLKGSELSQDTSGRLDVEQASLSRLNSIHQAQSPSLSSSRRRSFRLSPQTTEAEAEFQECLNQDDGGGDKRSVSPEPKQEDVARRRPWIDLLQLMTCGSYAVSKAKKSEKEMVRMSTEAPAESSRRRDVQLPDGKKCYSGSIIVDAEAARTATPVETREAAIVLHKSNSERCRKTGNVVGEIEEEEN